MNALIQAGAELDALIDHKVFGNQWACHDYVFINDCCIDMKTWLPAERMPDDPPSGWYAGMKPPPYSSSIQYAWRVVEEMSNDTVFGHHFMNRDFPNYTENVAATTICRLALEAIG